jgi:hypothetical protein
LASGATCGSGGSFSTVGGGTTVCGRATWFAGARRLRHEAHDHAGRETELGRHESGRHRILFGVPDHELVRQQLVDAVGCVSGAAGWLVQSNAVADVTVPLQRGDHGDEFRALAL